MICTTPLFLLLVMQGGKPTYMEVDPKYLKPEVQALGGEKYHAECRRRKLGDCLGQIRMNPINGHISFLCKTLERVENEKSSPLTPG